MYLLNSFTVAAIDHVFIFQMVPTIRDVLDEVTRFCADSIQSHKATYQADSPRDFIDIYLKKIDEMSATEDHSTFKGQVSYSYISIYTVLQILINKYYILI